MSIAKPFTFVANTYAKASEVNADFDTVYSQVNANISAIAANATDIDNLENNKADINGSSSQRFAVDDPLTNSDAINKQTLFKSIGNTLDYISGLVITRDSGSPDDTIIVSAGSCYDSGKTVILSLSDAVSKRNDNQSSGVTYNVFITSSSNTGTPTAIAITADSNPGTTKYRKIGYYKAVIGKSTEAYIVSGSTEFTSGWLSATDGGSALTPDTNMYYVVKTAGEYYNKIYKWNGSEYSEVSEISSTIGDIYNYGVDSSMPQPKDVLIETYRNGSDWYRVYSDGFCEQGGTGEYSARTALTITLLKAFNDTNYSVIALPDRDTNTYASTCCGHIISNSQFKVSSGNGTNEGTGYPVAGQTFWWRACGYIN